ncbi:MAG: alkaline phosphatase PhoX [Actinomycetota bacterium]|nr:alkaline phosphatase PhoX [Actinomycetota bacterium]
MDRRAFLQHGLAATAGIGLLTRTRTAEARSARRGTGPYGSIEGQTPDVNGLLLPDGFTSRVIAISGDPVGDTDHPWHLFPSGAATFPDSQGGWYLVSNSDVPSYLTPDETWGGASSVHFDADGRIVDAKRILAWSHSNAGGAPTPWGTWLSCEADFFSAGRIWECDPTGAGSPLVHEAMGLRNHGGAAVDPIGKMVYLTEDNPLGRFYRYTPNSWPDLSSGTLEVMTVAVDDSVSWNPVVDSSAEVGQGTERNDIGFTTTGGKGCWYHEGWVFFATRLDDRVHAVDLRKGSYELVWDGFGRRQPLTGIDDLTVDPWTGDLYVAEATGDLELVLISVDGDVAPFCRITDPAHELSAITGPCFDPDGRRLYVSSQRGPGNRPVRDTVPAIDWGDGPPGLLGGITYEITGPFVGRPVTAPTTTVTVSSTTTSVPAGTMVATTSTVASAESSDPTDTTPTTAPITTTTAASIPATTLITPATTTLAAASRKSASTTDDRGSDSKIKIGITVVATLGVAALVLRRRVSEANGDGSDGPPPTHPGGEGF